MSPNKRERERARKRHERWVQNQRIKARRRRNLALGSVAVLAMAAAVVLIIALSDREGSAPDPGDADAGPTDSVTEDAQQPLPTTEPQLYDSAPETSVAEDRSWSVVITTNVGEIELTLDGQAAPQAVANFVRLAQDGYYDGTACHRLLPDSLLQCGDPTAAGSGGPGYTFGPIENAPQDDLYPAGTVAMARVGNDGASMGSQFFLVFADVPLPSDSAGGYSVFGTVEEGIDLLTQIGAGGLGQDGVRPAQDVIIERVEAS